jgi:hypothetical protein
MPGGAVETELTDEKARDFEEMLDLDVEPHEAVRYYLGQVQVSVLPLKNVNYDLYVVDVIRHPRRNEWRVEHGGLWLNQVNQFVAPSSDIAAQCFFEYEQAIQRAALIAPEIVVNGVTALQALGTWKAVTSQ